MNRRIFLKSLGAAIGTIALAPVLPVLPGEVIHPKFQAVDMVITEAEIANLNAIAYQVMMGFASNNRTRDGYRIRGLAAARRYKELTGEYPVNPS